MSYFQQPNYQRRQSHHSVSGYPMYNMPSHNSQTNISYANNYHTPEVPITPLEYQGIPSSPYASPQFSHIPNYTSGYLPGSAVSPYYGQSRHPSHSNLKAYSSNNTLLTASNLNNDNTLDQLNISRTIVLKNLNDDLTLNELLNYVDFGPIEYIKMFSKPVNKSFEKVDPSIKNFKVCFISFINSKISINFMLKYQNLTNLQNLKMNLNSKHLKISLNDNKLVNNGMKDFIKLKTLNYILEFNATRAININLKYDVNFNIAEFLQELKTGLVKFGDFEDFKITEVDSNFKEVVDDDQIQDSRMGFAGDSDSNSDDVLEFSSETTKNPESSEFKYLSLQIHFNSIDSAIKCSEHYMKITQQDKEMLLENSHQSHYFYGCKFVKDRCDITTELQNLTLNDKSASVSESPKGAHSTVSMNCSSVDEQPDVESQEKDEFNNIDQDNEFDKSLHLNELSEVEDQEDSYLFGYGSTNDELQPPPIHQSTRSNFDSTSNYSNRSNSNGNLPSYGTSQGVQTTPSRGSFSMPVYRPFINAFNGSPGMNMGTSFDNPNYFYNPDPYNVGNRTIYLGNLHPSSTVEEIANNVRAGGLVESIKFYPDKRNCFITFIDPNIALKFYLNHQVLHQLIIHGYDINVGWAKTHSGALNREIALAVTAGASRNVYIGIKLNKDQEDPELENPDKPQLPSEEELREDFSHFGELEQINFYHNKDCGFLNFLNIYDAIKLVECFELKSIDRITHITEDPNFYLKYKDFKISFGKDRCGNPPKFSFKKRLGKSRQKIYFDSGNRNSKRDNAITDEAAMVFGIIKDGPDKESSEPIDSELLTKDPCIESTDSSVTEESTAEIIDCLVESGSVKVPREDAVNTGVHVEKGSSNAEHRDEVVKDGEEADEEADDDEVDDEVDDDDDDDDDDISIVIGSDDTSSTTAYNSNGKDKNYKKKFYNNLVNTSDSFIPIKSNKRSSSQNSNSKARPNSISIPKEHHGGPYGNQHTPMTYSSPHIAMHQFAPPVHHMSAAFHQMQVPPLMNGNASPHPYYMSRSNSGYGYYPQYTPVMPNTPIMNGAPGMFPPQMNNPQYYYDQSPSKGFSGSQVMAQYLAKSQTDNMFYQPNVVYDVDERRRKKS